MSPVSHPYFPPLPAVVLAAMEAEDVHGPTPSAPQCDVMDECTEDDLTHQPGVVTPQRVLSLLVAAFGEDKVGETGYDIAAAKCCSEQEKMDARQRGSSLLYGELLPDGVSKALHPARLGGALPSPGDVARGTVLELGMGSGKVALQTFVQCPTVKELFGIELVHSRYQIAEQALSELVAQHPKRFTISFYEPGLRIRAEEVSTKRLLEFRCGDFFTTGLDLARRSDIIFFAVNVPCKLFPQLCNHFASAKEGCRLFTYHALEAIWWTDQHCPFHQCEANVPDADTFSTSWSPQGFKFFVYTCDRSRPPALDSAHRNETYSEWQLVYDDHSGKYFYHNQETELSQWEVPTQAGCWQAVYCEEHKAHYFWHRPSGHSQWEVPRCMADLGWNVDA